MSMEVHKIRPAVAADLLAITTIFNHAVCHTLAIWQENTEAVGQRGAWLAARAAAGFPVLVAEDGDKRIVGYASYADFRAYPGFRHTVEHSVYVAPDAQGRGVGSALLQALTAYAQAHEVRVMVAAIEAGNAASIRLHAKQGFVQTGLMPKVGRKYGQWLDLCLMQKDLHSAD